MNSIKVTRCPEGDENQVTLEFETRVITRGVNTGDKYVAPIDSAFEPKLDAGETYKEKLDKLVEFLGVKETIQIIKSKMTLISLAATREATTKGDGFLPDLFVKQWENLSAKTQSKAQLVEEREKLLQQMDDLEDDDIEKFTSEMRRIKSELKVLNTEIKARERTKTTRKKKTATPAQSEEDDENEDGEEGEE